MNNSWVFESFSLLQSLNLTIIRGMFILAWGGLQTPTNFILKYFDFSCKDLFFVVQPWIDCCVWYSALSCPLSDRSKKHGRDEKTFVADPRLCCAGNAHTHTHTQKRTQVTHISRENLCVYLCVSLQFCMSEHRSCLCVATRCRVGLDVGGASGFKNTDRWFAAGISHEKLTCLN